MLEAGEPWGNARGTGYSLTPLDPSASAGVTVSTVLFLAHVDDSGDPGYKPGASQTFTLGCVMVEGDAWLNAFDRLISFRRHLRRLFGIPIRAEIKANHLLRNAGPFELRPLSEAARSDIYKMHLRAAHKLGLGVFAVVIDKQCLAQSTPDDKRPDPEGTAWEWLLQRLERRTFYEGTQGLLIHDQGEAAYNLRVRSAARKARRAGTAGSEFGTGILQVPFKGLLDDPVGRDSRQSYFLQLADLAAYAAFRRLYPPPHRPRQIVPQLMWDELRDARFREVTRGAEPFGIVHNRGSK